MFLFSSLKDAKLSANFLQDITLSLNVDAFFYHIRESSKEFSNFSFKPSGLAMVSLSHNIHWSLCRCDMNWPGICYCGVSLVPGSSVCISISY